MICVSSMDTDCEKLTKLTMGLSSVPSKALPWVLKEYLLCLFFMIKNPVRSAQVWRATGELYFNWICPLTIRKLISHVSVEFAPFKSLSRERKDDIVPPLDQPIKDQSLKMFGLYSEECITCKSDLVSYL